jgi:glycerate 2-kinase
MSNLTQLRLAAREIFAATLQAIDAGAAVRRAVGLQRSRLIICETSIEIGDRKIYSIAFGKAAVAMAAALEEILDQKLISGVLSGPDLGKVPGGIPALTPRHLVFHGGHPEPNEQSLAAAQACFELLERANQERALVIFLVSGGGSAMLESPVNGDITLETLRAANKALVNSGASIIEINAVRRTFSLVKGGRLAAKAPNCNQLTLIISDVPPGEETNVASGPTLPPATDAPAASEVVAHYDLRPHLPEAILRAIDAKDDAELSGPTETDSTLMRKHFLLLDNNSALKAAAYAARRMGLVAKIARDISDQSIEAGCDELLSRLGGMRANTDVQKTACLISGGEFACPVKGDGIGGRNLETALRLALLSRAEPFVALCAGTDGIDGNSPAAGAIVDNTTIARARAIGIDPEDFLRRSDAYSFFVALGDAVATGPTGTNVRDIRIMLAGA